MKILAILFLSLSSVIVYGQEPEPFDGHKWEAPYHFPTPQNWGIERFLIPISFAPKIPYKGVEDIRFTPGWANAKSEEYWSYAFLWYLDGKVTIDAKTIDSNLHAYYTGLVSINGQNIPAEKVIPVVTSFKKIKTENGDQETYTGTVKKTDYMSQKPIVLNAKVHLRSCPEENKTFIFYELSPQPLSHIVWASLDKLWLEFKCKKD